MYSIGISSPHLFFFFVEKTKVMIYISYPFILFTSPPFFMFDLPNTFSAFLEAIIPMPNDIQE